MTLCKISQIWQKASKTDSLFCKNVSPQAWNVTEKDTITGVFMWKYLYESVSFLF